MSNLTPSTPRSLEHCEIIIDRDQSATLRIGAALKIIRDGRLYKATHEDFNLYCLERHGFQRRRANIMVQGIEIYLELDQVRDLETVLSDLELEKVGSVDLTIGSADPTQVGSVDLTIGSADPTQVGSVDRILPINEWQIRPLSKLQTADQRRSAWAAAVQSAQENGVRITQALVEEVVDTLLPPHANNAQAVTKEEIAAWEAKNPRIGYRKPHKGSGRGFFMLDNDVADVIAPHVGPTPFLVLLMFYRHAYDGTCKRPDDKDIAKALGISRVTARSSVEKLVDMGLITDDGTTISLNDIDWAMSRNAWHDAAILKINPKAKQKAEAEEGNDHEQLRTNPGKPSRQSAKDPYAHLPGYQ